MSLFIPFHEETIRVGVHVVVGIRSDVRTGIRVVIPIKGIVYGIEENVRAMYDIAI